MSATIVAVAIAAIAQPGVEAPRRVELQWSAPAECPGGDVVSAAAERLLLDHDAELRARGVIEATPDGGYALTLVIERRDGTRVHRQEERECETLAGLAALLVAVAADPIAVVETGAVERETRPTPIVPEPVGAKARVAHGDAQAAARVPERAPRRQRPTGWIRVAGIIGFAELPTIDAGIGITGAIQIAHWRVELGASHLFAQEHELPGLAPAAARIAAWNATVRGCGELGRRSLWIGACIGPELGIVTGRAVQVASPDPNVSAWVAATLGPVLRWVPHERVQLHFGVEGVLALTRARFALADDPSAWVSTGPGGVRATLGIAIGLGRRSASARGRDQATPTRR